jgi:predicted CXXCH cytochrome family protein
VPATGPAVQVRAQPAQGVWNSAQDLAGLAVSWVLSRSTRFDTFWNPGPIASAHQSIAEDCRSCHAKPFERVADASCTHCHKSIGTHVSDPRMDRMVFQEQRCATCHKDHQGSTGMRTVDAIGCVQCHADVRRHAPTTQLANISDFSRDHPAFRLSVRSTAAGAQMQRVTQTAALQSDPGYSFPHDLHLAKAGIKSPGGPAATGGRVVLECASCHTLDAASVRYEPVRMDRHCQGCHRLSVDPQAPDRQVQHGKPEVVRTAVREIFASLAVDRYPVSLVTVNTLLQRPGADAPPSRTLGATQWVREQTERVMVSLFESPSGECRTCHAVQRAAPAKGAPTDWTVAPVASSSHWLPHSSFSHAQHKNADCGTCHAAGQSKSAADILLPDIKVCQGCHAGTKGEPDKVASRCESCHGFHGKPLHPSFTKSATSATVKP